MASPCGKEHIRPPQEVRRHLAGRVDITDEIAKVRKGVLPKAHYEEVFFDRDKALDLWDGLKLSRASIHSVIIQELFKTVRLERNFFVGTQKDPDVTLNILKNYTGHLLYSALSRVMHVLRHDTSAPITDESEVLTKTYKHYSRMMRMYENNFGTERSQRHAPEMLLLGSGIKTATEVTWGMVEALPALLHKEGKTMEVSEARECLDRAFQVTGRTLASFNLEHLSVILQHMFEEDDESGKVSVVPDFFILTHDGAQPTLNFNWDKALTLTTDFGEPLFSGEVKTPTTGCPIRHARGRDGREASLGLFEFVADLAEEHYLPVALPKAVTPIDLAKSS